MLSQPGWRTAIVVFGLVTASACAIGHPREVPDRATCFATATSLVHPLGDTTRVDPDPAGAWVMLYPDPPSSGDVRFAQSVDVLENRQEGTWQQSGDTLRIRLHDVFSNNSLVLLNAGPTFVGRGTGTRNVRVPGPNGAVRRIEHRWFASLKPISCAKVPRRFNPPTR